MEHFFVEFRGFLTLFYLSIFVLLPKGREACEIISVQQISVADQDRQISIRLLPLKNVNKIRIVCANFLFQLIFVIKILTICVQNEN